LILDCSTLFCFLLQPHNSNCFPLNGEDEVH
jgi:hypothetical protein